MIPLFHEQVIASRGPRSKASPSASASRSSCTRTCRSGLGDRPPSGDFDVDLPPFPGTSGCPRVRFRRHPGSRAPGPLVGPGRVHEHVSHLRVPGGAAPGHSRCTARTGPTIRTSRNSWRSFRLPSSGSNTSAYRASSSPSLWRPARRESSFPGSGPSENSAFAEKARTFLEGANEQNLDRLAREVGTTGPPTKV